MVSRLVYIFCEFNKLLYFCMKDNEPTLESLMDDFNFEVPLEESPIKPIVDVVLETTETEEETESDKTAVDKEEEVNKTEEELAEEAEAERKAAIASKGSNPQVFKDLAHKYMEKGKWDKELSIEDENGDVVLVSSLETIDEDTFFQIEEAIAAQDSENNKDKFISVEGLDERKRNLIEILKEGGDLSTIFASKEQVNEYLNPFDNIDLDDEAVQERVFLNALIQHNKLDADAAQAVVDKAKKDMTLDTKVQAFVTAYNKRFDAYVESEKVKIIEANKEAKKQEAEFKKALSEEYKKFDLKDTLSRKLTSIATSRQADGEYEIDAMYAKKMEDPTEAAELVLFLTDKETYLKAKLSKQVITEHKKVRQTIKLVPKEKTTNKRAEDTEDTSVSEFKFKV